jgi:hypothetical protein
MMTTIAASAKALRNGYNICIAIKPTAPSELKKKVYSTIRFFPIV